MESTANAHVNVRKDAAGDEFFCSKDLITCIFLPSPIYRNSASTQRIFPHTLGALINQGQVKPAMFFVEVNDDKSSWYSAILASVGGLFLGGGLAFKTDSHALAHI